jgi:hypothetical protein
MKKLLTYILFSVILFSGCEPNEEIYEKLDQQAKPFSRSFSYTMTPADYGNIYDATVSEKMRFSADHDPKELIPGFLANQYSALDSGSTIEITYNYYLGNEEYLDKFETAPADTMEEVDYDSLGFEDSYFSNSNLPEEYLPQYLVSKNSNFYRAPVGSLVEIYYNYQTEYEETNLESSFMYLFDYGWTKLPDFYKLDSMDYLSIEGISDNYFSSYKQPDKYLPPLLKKLFPYADDGSSKIIEFNYPDDESRVFQEFFLDSNEWVSTVVRTENYFHNGNKWVYTSIINYEMVQEDYQAVVDYVANDSTLKKYLDPEYSDNTELYYGSNAYYGNFDMRAYIREEVDSATFYGTSDEKARQIMFERLLIESEDRVGEQPAIEIVLQNRFPEAEPLEEGSPVIYSVSFATWEPNDYVYTVKFRCTKPADGDVPPQFEYISGNTPYNE